MAKTKHKTPPLTPEQTSRLVAVTEMAVSNFRGDVSDLESALGMYVIGRHVGWKVLYIIHSKRTIRKYEDILGIAVREEFPEIGLDASRSMGFKVLETVSNFWKAISGGEPIPNRRIID